MNNEKQQVGEERRKLPFPRTIVLGKHDNKLVDENGFYLEGASLREVVRRYNAFSGLLDALRSLEPDEPQPPPRSDAIKQFERIGFVVEDTGGGCQWLRKPLSNGLSLVVTDGEAHLPELTAVIYLMRDEGDEGGDAIAQSHERSIYDTLATLEGVE